TGLALGLAALDRGLFPGLSAQLASGLSAPPSRRAGLLAAPYGAIVEETLFRVCVQPLAARAALRVLDRRRPPGDGLMAAPPAPARRPPARRPTARPAPPPPRPPPASSRGPCCSTRWPAWRSAGSRGSARSARR